MIKIAVRLDDITPDMDWDKFLEFKGILDEFHIKPLIGVVPFNRDENLKGNTEKAPENFWAYVKTLQEEGWCVALHGYDHLYSTTKKGLFPLNNFSEFAGVTYEEQVRQLKDGRKMLSMEGIETDIFMAPAHSFDRNTLKALKDSGFTKLTDGFGNKPYRWQGMDFYPISFLLRKTLNQKEGYSTLVVHTGTINNMAAYREYFSRNNIEWIDYTDYLQAPMVKRGYLGHLKEYWMACIKGALGRVMAALRK